MNSLSPIPRRRFLERCAASGLALSAAVALPQVLLAETPKRKLRLYLSPGSIGVQANQAEALRLAARHGFEAVEPDANYLAQLDGNSLDTLLAKLNGKDLTWGTAGLPVEFRRDDSTFEAGLRRLPAVARGLQRAGVKRVGTWVMPCHRTLTYLENFRQHTQRLREVAKVLGDHELRLGLEYVGTFTLLVSQKYPFIHTLAEMRDLVGAIGRDNVGVVLDSWHWWQADDTAAAIRALRASDVVSVDLNDAPTGVPKRQQRDGRRELPLATGVIDVGPLLNALNQIGYDGPMRAEPFNQALNKLDNDDACAATIASLKKAVALIHGA